MSENKIIVHIDGCEEIKVKGCKHKKLVHVIDHYLCYWAYCSVCGLRTPTSCSLNAEDMMKKAEREGTLYRDMTRLRKNYFLNKEKNEITSSLGYVDEEKEAWWLESKEEVPEGEAFHGGKDDDGLKAFRKSWEADAGGLIANHPDKPCRAMRTGKHLVGDLPRLSPKGKCYYDHQKDCNAWCRCWEGDEDDKAVKKIREIQDNIKKCGLPNTMAWLLSF